MATDENLMRLADICFKSHNYLYVDKNGKLDEEKLNYLFKVFPFTDIYVLPSFYRHFKETVFRSLTISQDQMLLEHFRSKINKSVASGSHVYIALNMGKDANPEEVTEPNQIVFGII